MVLRRLWDEDDVLEEQVTPELLDADLAPLALNLAAWGSPGGTGLPWLDTPDPDRMKTADELLMDLGAITQTGAVTREGEKGFGRRGGVYGVRQYGRRV